MVPVSGACVMGIIPSLLFLPRSYLSTVPPLCGPWSSCLLPRLIEWLIDERSLHTIVKRVDHSNVFRMGEGGLGSDVPQWGSRARGWGTIFHRSWSLFVRIIIGSDRRPETKQGIKGKIDRFGSGKVRVRDRVRVRYNWSPIWTRSEPFTDFVLPQNQNSGIH